MTEFEFQKQNFVCALKIISLEGYQDEINIDSRWSNLQSSSIVPKKSCKIFILLISFFVCKNRQIVVQNCKSVCESCNTQPIKVTYLPQSWISGHHVAALFGRWSMIANPIGCQQSQREGVSMHANSNLAE
jgi:hypothetical protein